MFFFFMYMWCGYYFVNQKTTQALLKIVDNLKGQTNLQFESTRSLTGYRPIDNLMSCMLMGL